jgi:hypothetical protein
LIAERDMIAAERLQREIGIGDLVVGVRIQQLDGLVVHHLAQQRGDRLSLVEPLPSDLGQQLGGVLLVERDEAGDPAIGEVRWLSASSIPWPAHVGKAGDRQRAHMRLPSIGSKPADQRRVREQAVQIHGRVWHGHGMATVEMQPCR